MFDSCAMELLLEYAKDEHVDGVCLLGGEVFHQPLDEMYDIIAKIRDEVKKPIHVWTGYKWEHLIIDPDKKKILSLIDTLVDGPFIEELKDINLKYRGSSNQRVIDVKKTLENGGIIEWDMN